jgi:PAS domain S-box-containing protein
MNARVPKNNIRNHIVISHSKFEEIKASGQLPSPNGVAMRVIELTRMDDVTNQEIARVIKADPVLSGRLVKAANALVAYQTRPIASIVEAVTVLGLNSVRTLVLSLSLIDEHLEGTCPLFDYQDFWAHSLLTAITAQNLVLQSGIGSTEEVFVLGLLGQIGSLALATVYPQQYARILAELRSNEAADLASLERAEFGFDHNQLTQAMLADWGMPLLFQQFVLFHESPAQSDFAEDSRNWRLLNILHIADYFSGVCLAQGSRRRQMVPKLILNATRLGVEMDELVKLGDKSVSEWHEWSKLCSIRSVAVPHFEELLEAVPLVPGMLDTNDEPQHGGGVFYKLRILLVDDDRAILLLLKTLLEKAGHTVTTASNGAEGLDVIEKFKPQLIITDWMMPKMNGIDFCKALRENPAWRNIYVFIMTAQEGMEKLVEAFEAGANDFLSKPVNPKVLLARLRAGQRVVQLQEEIEFDRQQLHQFADELATSNQRLRKSDVNLRAIFDNSPYMAWLKDKEGRYIKVNKKYAQYVRLEDPRQIIGKTDFDLWPKEMAVKYRVDDAEVISTRQLKRFEDASLDGKNLHWVETFKTPVIDMNNMVIGTTGFARDITERKESEHALKMESEKNSALLHNASDGIHILDSEGNVVVASDSFCDMLGYTQEEIIGLNVADWDTKYSSDKLKSGFKQEHGNGRLIETIYRRKDGTLLDVEINISTMSLDGCAYIFASGRDITQKNKLANELLHTAEQLRELVANFETLQEAERKSIAREVHDELGQTLSMLRLDLSMTSARFGKDNAELMTMIQNMKDHVDRAIHGVRNVSENLRPAVMEMGIVTAIEWLCEDFSARSGISCSMKSPAQSVDLNEATAVGIFRIVQESLTNVIRHANAHEVGVAILLGDDTLSVQVRDNGAGFDMKASKQQESFGLLGMRERARAFGGQLSIVSGIGNGTTVSVGIPFHPGENKP